MKHSGMCPEGIQAVGDVTVVCSPAREAPFRWASEAQSWTIRQALWKSQSVLLILGQEKKGGCLS